MADSFIWSNSSVTGDISGLFSTGMTTDSWEESPEEERERKKKDIKDMIGDDKYLLQELLTELRKEKLDQLKNGES